MNALPTDQLDILKVVERGTTAPNPHYVSGEWLDTNWEDRILVVNPATEEAVGEVYAGTAEDIDRAVDAARVAFPEWSSLSLDERVELLGRVGATISAHREELALLITRELGMPIRFTREVQVDSPARAFSQIGAYAERISWEQCSGNTTIVKEPLGVVGAITPWNFPLEQVAVKIAPALVAGCTVVLKPSEVNPLSAVALAEIFETVGVPAGVFNVVNGIGPVVGEALAGHSGVDMVSFTGSTRAGRRVSQLAGANITPVAVELGGKSPNVILDGAPLEEAIAAGVASCYFNAGQTCSALTRMLVPRGRLGEVEEVAMAVAESYEVGDPLDDSTAIGPLVSDVQRSRVRGYIEAGVQDGAELLLGGGAPPANLSRGYYVPATVFSKVEGGMRIAQEEIFGPVLAIIPYDSEAEAVSLANGTPYGLAAAVWADSRERALDTARKLRAGQVQINGGEDDPTAPFGGFKQSGHGRENGPWGIEGFIAPKALLS